ncbi:GGDEF domain-containing protein [Vibrio sp. M260118]|uniref:GGDEF domain-containing protein n=1 Tax=Vibrio sp. M260118 TaxID=3020896 RepID=UPI002F408D80
MRNKDTDQLPQLLKRAKYLLLLISALLIVANFYFLNETREHAKSYSEQQNQATWFLFQLTKEFSELNATLPFVALDEASKQTALLKYELTWSRFDLLISSRESDNFIGLPGAETFFLALFDNFKALEPKLNSESPQVIEEVSQEFEALYLSMISYVNANFRVQSPLYQNQMDQARDLFNLQLTSLLLLIVGVLIVTYIFQKESLYHREQSLTDALTEIPNRLAFMEHLTDLESRGKVFSLVLLDLNGFKKINDNHGHQAGDSALKTIAHRLRRLSISYKLSTFRIGGDEFALVVREIQQDELNAAITDIEHCFSQSMIIEGNQEVSLSTSIGISHYPSDSTKLHHLISIADQNMYEMKFAQKENSNNVIPLQK